MGNLVRGEFGKKAPVVQPDIHYSKPFQEITKLDVSFLGWEGDIGRFNCIKLIKLGDAAPAYITKEIRKPLTEIETERHAKDTPDAFKIAYGVALHTKGKQASRAPFATLSA